MNLRYTGNVLEPQFKLTYGDFEVKNFTTTYSAEVKNAGSYVATFTANGDELFTGTTTYTFAVAKSTSGNLDDLVLNKTAGDDYWTAQSFNKFPDNLNLQINPKEDTTYSLDINGGSQGTLLNEAEVYDAIKTFDNTHTEAYTLTLKITAAATSNYNEDVWEQKDINVGKKAWTITPSVDPKGAGNVKADPSTAQAGEKITLTYDANKSFKFDKFEVKTATGSTTVPVAADGTFVMPADDVKVTAVFVKQYTIEFGEGYTVIAENGEVVSKETYVDANEKITIKADVGLKFDAVPTVTPVTAGVLAPGVTAVGDSVTEYDFTMPASDVKIAAKTAVDLMIKLVEGDGYKDITFTGMAPGKVFILPSPADHDRWVLTYGETERYYNGCSAYYVDVAEAVDGVIIFNAVDIETTEYAKVTFVYGSDSYSIDVAKGSAIGILPAAAVQDGKILTWKCGDDIVTEETKVGGDMIVVASYKDIPVDTVFEVTFVYGLDGKTEYTINVVEGKTIGIMPYAAAIDGYTLKWMSGGNVVTEETIVNADMTVEAKYEAVLPVETGDKTVKVTFEYDGKTTVVTIKKGTAVGMTPADAAKDGYTLTWNVAGAEFDVNASIDEDTTVTAVYKPISVPSVEYSEVMSVSLAFVDGKIYYSVSAMDGKTVPAGKVAITYTYLVEVDGYEFLKTVNLKDISVNETDKIATGSVSVSQDVYSISASFQYKDGSVASPKYFIESEATA